MRLSQRGARLIEEYEGFSAKPYLDPVGIPTIGYGSTAGVTMRSPHVTRAQAERRLMREVDANYGRAVNALNLPLSQNAFDALVSFTYNCGPGAIGPSTGVGRALRRANWSAAADALLAWDKAGGRTLPGLTRRRHAERALFLEPVQAIGPAAWLTPAELRWVREFDRGPTPERRKVLVIVMRKQRKRIWQAAQPRSEGGDGRGWKYAHRRDRYHSLLTRS